MFHNAIRVTTHCVNKCASTCLMYFHYIVRLAALRRATVVTKPVPTIPSSPTGLHLQVSRLDDLCVKLLVRRSRDYGLPSCTGLSSVVAESLITALANNKILNPKTLGAFSKWLEPLLLHVYCLGLSSNTRDYVYTAVIHIQLLQQHFKLCSIQAKSYILFPH